MIIWIASYPKSGNTWIRSLLASYLFSKDGKFSFKLLKNIERFSVKSHLVNLSSGTDYQTRIYRNWIRSQEIINKDKKIRFLKTHNAMCTINGNKFTDKLNTTATIYIVRDPRNIISSLAHHYEFGLEEAFNFLINKRKIIFPIDFVNDKKIAKTPNDFNFLGDWSSHYKSWKNISFCPIKIIKYEDLLAYPDKSFVSILNFLSNFFKFKLDKKKIDNALSSTSFNSLSQMEKSEGFDESPISSKTKKKIKFFHLGKRNNWNTLLDKKLIEKIETQFRNEMSELGYL